MKPISFFVILVFAALVFLNGCQSDAPKEESEVEEAESLTSVRESLSYESLNLKGGGTVVVWGNNQEEQCDVPSGLTDVVGIAAGDYHTLVLKKDDTVVARGDNLEQQCDVPSDLTDVVGLAAGGYHNLVLRKTSEQEKQAIRMAAMVEKQAMEAMEAELKARHSEIVAKSYRAMTAFMEGFNSITDVKSAEASSKTIEGVNATLKEILAAAEALAPPTTEEKKAWKVNMESFESKFSMIPQETIKMMTENRDAAAIILLKSNISVLMGTVERLEYIYGL